MQGRAGAAHPPLPPPTSAQGRLEYIALNLGHDYNHMMVECVNCAKLFVRGTAFEHLCALSPKPVNPLAHRASLPSP